MFANVKILIEGYTTADTKAESGGEEKTCPTISLVRDEDLVMVVDPGVLDSQQILIDALEKEGLKPHDVNMVCITHSHIDHYRNIGMFPNAKTLEFFGVWDRGMCEEWHEQFASNIQILRTPGHDATSITLFVNTEKGIVAICGDVFWKENGPEDDPYAFDAVTLNKSRETVVRMSDWIIPGHGPMYKTTKGVIKNIKKIMARSVEPKVSAVCKQCKQLIKRPQDRCECRPWLCYHCCDCHTDCDNCNCSHKL